jgi:hypothetical protein
MSTFKALGHEGTIATRINKDGSIERTFRVLVGLELFEYKDTISEADMHTERGRLGPLRDRAIIKRMEREMAKRGIRVHLPS